MIYESRPIVGADAGALCLESGNAVILCGGSESLRSTRRIVAYLAKGLKAADLPEHCVQRVDTVDRAAVAALLRCTTYIDLAIPRGGRGLVELVRDEARLPTLLYLDGNCYTYFHSDADLDKAVDIVKNAKMRRKGVCGATESLAVDAAIAAKFLPRLVVALTGCKIRGDELAQRCDPSIKAATDFDWDTAYLDAILSGKTVENLEGARTVVDRH